MGTFSVAAGRQLPNYFNDSNGPGLDGFVNGRGAPATAVATPVKERV